jgi:hypothetical protein
MQKNYFVILYFISGFFASFSMMLSTGEIYINLLGLTFFFYLAFTLIDSIENLDL